VLRRTPLTRVYVRDKTSYALLHKIWSFCPDWTLKNIVTRTTTFLPRLLNIEIVAVLVEYIKHGDHLAGAVVLKLFKY